MPTKKHPRLPACLPGSQDLDLDGWMEAWSHQPRHPLALKKKKGPQMKRSVRVQLGRHPVIRDGYAYLPLSGRAAHERESDKIQTAAQQPRLCMFGLDSRAWPRTPHGVPVPPCVCACPCRCLARLGSCAYKEYRPQLGMDYIRNSSYRRQIQNVLNFLYHVYRLYDEVVLKKLKHIII